MRCQPLRRALGKTMTPCIAFKKIWNDDDLIELTVQVCNGQSMFSNNIYADADALTQLIKDLSIFRNQIYGGLYDIKLGEFGVEYANGGFQARLHFHNQGKLLISTYQQTEFMEFPKTQVASEAKMYLSTEPVLLDNFITNLKILNSGSSDEAILVCA